MARRAQNRMVGESESAVVAVAIPEPEPPRPEGEIHSVRIFPNGWLEAFGEDQHQIRRFAGIAMERWPTVRANLASGARVLAMKFGQPVPITAAQRAALDAGDIRWREAR